MKRELLTIKLNDPFDQIFGNARSLGLFWSDRHFGWIRFLPYRRLGLGRWAQRDVLGSLPCHKCKSPSDSLPGDHGSLFGKFSGDLPGIQSFALKFIYFLVDIWSDWCFKQAIFVPSEFRRFFDWRNWCLAEFFLQMVSKSCFAAILRVGIYFNFIKHAFHQVPRLF